MQIPSSTRPVLFANSGIQIVTVPLPPALRLSADQVGSGWQYCECRQQDKIVKYGYLQWQVLRGRLLLAVDTTLGPDDSEVGYFCKQSTFGSDFSQTVTNLVGLRGEVVPNLPPAEFVIRPAAAEGGEPRDVHMVVDFGNCRTGALLVEFRGDAAQEPLMTPMQLYHRYHLDAWDNQGNPVAGNASWWFSSRTHWCTPAYQPAPKLEKIIHKERIVRTMFGEKTEYVSATVFELPRTFEDISMVRMGREADDLATIIRTSGEVRLGVSSPKRYLWAKDSHWLEGAIWHMADPFDRYDPEHHATPLKGPFLRFFPEDDLAESPAPNFEPAPAKPRYAPRILMAGALYELLCQAYVYLNSPGYRHLTGDAGRMRLLRSLTLTFPSGMIASEREQFQRQAQNAISVFMQTLGRSQPFAPELKLSIDEASAVHLTYIWSEVQKLGRKPSLWFSVIGRQTPAEPVEKEPEPAAGAKPAGRPSRWGRSGRPAPRAEGALKSDYEMRIACIDIGGGTSDLMIARYHCKTDIGGDVIEGETLHRDGISLAGDHLVKRLLETTVVPEFAATVGLEEADAHMLFGREVPANRPFRAQRIHWINRLFVPLAQAYLENAVDEVDDRISHTDPNIVAEEVVDSLQETIDRVWKSGVYNVRQDMNLRYDRERFADIVEEVFGDLLFDFCETIVEHKADVVLLAGQPTKLQFIQDMVESYLPLPKSRIMPMFGRYAGTWYPYQNPDGHNPGVIVDPKSTVVVGAAIEFMARHGMLPQFKFRMTDTAARKSYYWGVMTESRIDHEKIIFERQPEGQPPGSQRKEIRVGAQNLVIGRKRRSRDMAQASPVYLLKVHRGARLGEIDVKAALERRVGADGEEEVALLSVDGVVDGEPAVLGENVVFEWRTLADERYYLDTGGLDKLELG